MTRRVLITGAAGNLGHKAISALAKLDGVAVIGIDDRVAGDLRPGVGLVDADLSKYDRSWAVRFRDIDVVLHLAADPRPVATWESVVRSNIDLSLNVLQAAEENGVERFVFASSNWVLGGSASFGNAIRTRRPSSMRWEMG